jgi:hypothetical protein
MVWASVGHLALQLADEEPAVSMQKNEVAVDQGLVAMPSLVRVDQEEAT